MPGTRTLSQYQDDVGNLGVPDLEDAILTQCLNQAQSDVCATRLWSFRMTENTITGGSESVTNLGVIHSAYYSGSDGSETTIPIRDKRDLQDEGANLSDTTENAPSCFYLDGATTVASYPLNDFVLVYYANPTEMSATTDVSILPDEMQLALIYQAGGHAFARVGVLDISANYFGLAKQVMDTFDPLYNTAYTSHLPARYFNPE